MIFEVGLETSVGGVRAIVLRSPASLKMSKGHAEICPNDNAALRALAVFLKRSGAKRITLDVVSDRRVPVSRARAVETWDRGQVIAVTRLGPSSIGTDRPEARYQIVRTSDGVFRLDWLVPERRSLQAQGERIADVIEHRPRTVWKHKLGPSTQLTQRLAQEMALEAVRWVPSVEGVIPYDAYVLRARGVPTKVIVGTSGADHLVLSLHRDERWELERMNYTIVHDAALKRPIQISSTCEEISRGEKFDTFSSWEYLGKRRFTIAAIHYFWHELAPRLRDPFAVWHFHPYANRVVPMEVGRRAIELSRAYLHSGPSYDEPVWITANIMFDGRFGVRPATPTPRFEALRSILTRMLEDFYVSRRGDGDMLPVRLFVPPAESHHQKLVAQRMLPVLLEAEEYSASEVGQLVEAASGRRDAA